MRANWNPELEQRIRRADPVETLMPELLVVGNADILRRKDQWNNADSLTGLTVHDDGTVTLARTVDTILSRTTSNTTVTDLDRASPFPVGRVTWGGGEPEDYTIDRIIVNVTGNTGGGEEVDTWVLELWALERVTNVDGGQVTDLSEFHLVEIGRASVASPGPTQQDITFDFTAQRTRPAPKRVRPDDGGENAFPDPVTFVFLFALKSDGTAAANVAWHYDTAVTQVTSGGNILDSTTLTTLGSSDFGIFEADPPASTQVPRMTIESGTYTAATIRFSANPIDLSAVPTRDVEFLAESEEPSGSSLAFIVRNDADTADVSYDDGDFDSDLAGVGKNQTYEVACTLTPNAAGTITPVLRGMGARELTIHDMRGIVEVTGGRSSVDPFEMVGEIAEIGIFTARDGERDYRDVMSDVLSQNPPANLAWRFFEGHPDLDRSLWMRKDEYPFMKSSRGLAEGILTEWLSPLARLRRILPVYNTVADTLDPLRYANSSLKDTWEDVVFTQATLPPRYRGPGPEDDTTTVSKEIQQSRCKQEVDAISFLADGATISSQGQIKYVAMHVDGAALRLFPQEEISEVLVSPGLEVRVPEFFVDYDWIEDERRFDKLKYSVNAAALEDLGIETLEGVERLAPEIGKWITSATHAQTIADRQVLKFGGGMISLQWQSQYRYPELEPGDVVAVQTDRFVAKDPLFARALRGPLWFLCVLTACSFDGTDFTAWVPRYTDILAEVAEGATTVEFKRHRCAVSDAGPDNFAPGSAFDLPQDTESVDTSDMHDTVTNNERVTVPVGGTGIYELAGTIELEVTTTFSPQRAISVSYRVDGVTIVPGSVILIDTSVADPNLTYTLPTITVKINANSYVSMHISLPSGGSGLGQVNKRQLTVTRMTG